MKISKNSLLVRIIFYNNLAIILVSITIALFLIFIAFQNIEMKVLDTAKDKISLVHQAYNTRAFKARDDINRTLRNIMKDDKEFLEKSYSNQIGILKKEMAKDKYKNCIIALVDKDGKILSEDSTLSIFSSIDIEKFKKNIVNNEKNIKNNYIFKINDSIYSRIVVKYPSENLYILMTLPFDTEVLRELSTLAGLNEKDKIFLFVDGKYRAGTFKKLDVNILQFKKNDRKISKRGYNYLYKKIKIDKDMYYVILNDLYNYNVDYIGTLGIGIYYENIEIMKIAISVSVLFIVLIFIGLSTTITAKIFRNLLNPLSKVVNAAEQLSDGHYDINLKPEGVDEVRSLSRTFNRMVNEIRKNQEENSEKNKNLSIALKRINAIEKILMNIHIEDSMTITIKNLLRAFTSEMGLGYSRAMYFRYSRETDTLVGEFSAINNKLKQELLNSNFSNMGFKFQIEELDKLIKLIKIPFKNNNLIAKSLIEKRIVSYNEKGYRQELGNDLFKSLGINNYLIMPIYSDSRNYGCILVDYFGKDRKISVEEIELLTLLFLNLTIRIKNKRLEIEKIDNERTTTIGKLVNRFFNDQEVSLDKILDFLEKAYSNKSSEFLNAQIEDIKKMINKLNIGQEILNEYISLKKADILEVVDIEEVINEIVEELSPILAENRISISTFINCNAKVLGSRNRLKRAFCELIRNAKDSFKTQNEKSENKKINITVTQEKNTDKIKIHIIDNGCGMNEKQLKNIFEPFVGYNENTPGLGLAIVLRIIKDHNGVIKYSSTMGEGTDAKITLNIYKEEII